VEQVAATVGLRVAAELHLMNYLLYAWAPIARRCHSLRYLQ
jgi:hypothetical protein